MSHSSSAQIKTLSNAIADIYLPASDDSTNPRSVADILRPLMLEIRRSRMSGAPMRQDIVERFCTPPTTR